MLPAEETGDDSYEPPPVEQETRTVHPALPFARGEYVGEALGAQPSGQRGGEGRPSLVGTSHSPPPIESSGHSQVMEPQLASLPI